MFLSLKCLNIIRVYVVIIRVYVAILVYVVHVILRVYVVIIRVYVAIIRVYVVIIRVYVVIIRVYVVIKPSCKNILPCSKLNPVPVRCVLYGRRLSAFLRNTRNTEFVSSKLQQFVHSSTACTEVTH